MRAALAASAAFLAAAVLVSGAVPAHGAGRGDPTTSSNTPLGPSGLYQPIVRYRALDSRGAGLVATGDTTHIRVTGVGGIPATGVVAVSANVTVLKPRVIGAVSVFADGTSWSGETISYHVGQTIQNLETVPVGASGKIDMRNDSAGLLPLIVDILGYYSSNQAGTSGRYQPMAPGRVLDTRTGQPVAAGQTRTFPVAGRARIPQGDVVPVLNFTVLTPSRTGSLSVWANGQGTPTTPSLSFTAGQTEQSQLTMGLDGSGGLSIRNNSTAAVQVIADAVGYFTLIPAQPSQPFFAWGGYVRSYDSRTTASGTIPASGTVQIPVQATLAARWGKAAFANGLTAVSMNVTVLSPPSSRSLSLWPGNARWDGSATITFTGGQTMQRMVLIQAAGQAGQPATVQLRNDDIVPVAVVVDINGWVVSTA